MYTNKLSFSNSNKKKKSKDKNYIINILRENNNQHLYPAKISFRNEDMVRTLQAKTDRICYQQIFRKEGTIFFGQKMTPVRRQTVERNNSKDSHI